MNRKIKFSEKLVKAMDKGWKPKDPLLVPKIECLPPDLFEKALDAALARRTEKEKK